MEAHLRSTWRAGGSFSHLHFQVLQPWELANEVQVWVLERGGGRALVACADAQMVHAQQQVLLSRDGSAIAQS